MRLLAAPHYISNSPMTSTKSSIRFSLSVIIACCVSMFFLWLSSSLIVLEFSASKCLICKAYLSIYPCKSLIFSFFYCTSDSSFLFAMAGIINAFGNVCLLTTIALCSVLSKLYCTIRLLNVSSRPLCLRVNSSLSPSAFWSLYNN